MNQLPFGYIKLRLADRKANPMTNLIHHWSGGSMNFTWESLVLIVAGVFAENFRNEINRTNDFNSNGCHDFNRNYYRAVNHQVQPFQNINCGGNFYNNIHRYGMDSNEIELH